MSADVISKFQPDRTMYLRGFTGFGAAASLYGASPTGFNVSGVFRDMADFCVLVIWDADNSFEHYSVRYLPDFDLSGVTITFDVTYQGLQPIDSAKYSWIGWSQMEVVGVNRVTGSDIAVPSGTSYPRLWDYATLQSGSYSVSQGTYKISVPGTCANYDRVTLFVNDITFDFLANGDGKETAGYVAATLADQINTHDWTTFSGNSVAVIASADQTGALTLKNSRTGHVEVNKSQVQWIDGIKFPGIAVGSPIYLAGVGYVVSHVVSPTALVLTSPAPSGIVAYLAEYGGVDGNCTTTYMVVRPGNQSLSVDKTEVPLTGGNSDNVTWTVALDFDKLAREYPALGMDYLRQAWLTFAPQLTVGSDYLATEWTASFKNWSVTSTAAHTKLLCASPGSVRIGNDQHTGCTFSGLGWSTVAANNYWHGFGKQASVVGDSVTINYNCASAHDLYLGTSLNANRGVVTASLDGDQVTTHSLLLDSYAELVTRRVLRRSVPSGLHTLTLRLAPNTPVATTFLFDFIEAVVPGDLPDPLVTYANVSPALDYDTDATYKVSPQRLLWHLAKLGFAGHINEYLGVFWWNQRKRASSIWNSVVVTFSGTWVHDDKATLTFDTAPFIVPFTKTVTTWDTVDTIASHFLYYINSASIKIRAEKTGTGQLTIYTRTPNWKEAAFSVSSTSQAGVIQTQNMAFDQASNTSAPSNALTLDYGKDGVWQVDTSAPNPLNFAVRQWHSDFFSTAAKHGLHVTTSFSMELVNPPTDDGGITNTWCARFHDGSLVQTDTGFSDLTSTQCAPVPNLTAFQATAFTAMAALQSAAGLTPWLQFGEFLWWFFSSMSQPVGYCQNHNPTSIGLQNPHGMKSGDRVVISGVRGCPAANGTWTITVTDPTHFSIPVGADGDWQPGTGIVRGGSMALYDAVTAANAETKLGRSLYKFTCQDDDASVNGGSDSGLLAAQLKTHVDGIRSAVLANFPNAQFEILFPNDVNNPSCYSGPNVPYPQGGRLNAAINLPPAWMKKDTSGFNRFKVEALSWGSQYLDLNMAEQAINLAMTAPFAWPAADVAYLVPWFNGTCPWPHEYHSASTRGVGLINFWAYDHLALMSWPLPFVPPVRRAFRKL